MLLIVSSGLIVYKKFWIFPDNIFGVTLKFENFSKTLLFEFLSFSITLLFCSFIIFKITHSTSISSNYIYFIKRKINGLFVL